ncbi:S1 family peptidase [Nostoc sp.]|uniref:S1 family peptidase n=1 Tax=Nostoc sp. TaxID=1180 RepID=UPI002FF4DA88
MGNEDDLQRCIVRLNVASSQGTGFFVAPNRILTFAHVVKCAKDNSVQVFWKIGNQNYTAKVMESYEDPVDLALLQLDEDCLHHPCVELDDTEPNTNDDLYIFGYPKGNGVDYSQGDSASFKYEGISFKKDIILYKLKQGQVISGFSGSPLLNLRTGKVCGIVHLSRDEGSDLGGRAVSAQVIVQQFPEIALLNQQFHQPKPKGDNPFEYGSPVSPQRFYGRKREILEIKNRIGAISPQCVNLVGLRRNGKTSLLRYIRERISKFCSPEQKPLVVALDLTSGNFHTPKGIIEGLR